ncbi:MAG: hypothetical protein ACI30I_11405 [Parabacteroides sp.]
MNDLWIYIGWMGAIALISIAFAAGYWGGQRYERFKQTKQRIRHDQHDRLDRHRETRAFQQHIEALKEKMHQQEALLQEEPAEQDERIDTDVLQQIVDMKRDPLHANLSKEDWNAIFEATDLLFNGFLTQLHEETGLTRHEQEICCLLKWNFSRKEQLALFHNTTDALTKSKSRLKKRLQLSEKEDLDTFIRLL